MSDDAPLPALDSLWDYNDPDATGDRFRALLPRAAADTAYHTELLTQIARTQGLERRFDEAHATLDEARALWPAASGRPYVRYLLERGRVFNSSGTPDDAIPLFKEALRQAEAAGEDALAVDAAHMLGIAAPPADRLAWNLRALELAEASDDPRAQRWRGSLDNNIGWTYHDGGDYEAALAHFNRALAFRREQGDPEEIRIARWCVARGLRSVGQLDEALAAQRALLDEYDAEDEDAGYVYEEIAECLLALGDEAAARPYFAEAYRVLGEDPWLQAEQPERLARLEAMSRA